MKTLLSVLALLCCTNSFAQITIVTPAKGTAMGSVPYSPAKRAAYAEKLQHSTTLFVLQYRDYERQTAFENAIKETWTYTPYKIIRPEELASYEGKDGYSFFTFGAYYTGKHNHVQHLCYDLWYPMLNKKGKLKNQYVYSRILLYPESITPRSMLRYANGKHKYDAELMKPMLNDMWFFNWNVATLKGYLITANRFLNNNISHNITEGYRDETLSTLKTDTLYIADYAKRKEAVFIGPNYIDSTMTEGTLHQSYPYPVRYVTAKELDMLVADKNRDVRYLVFTWDGSEKYIYVFSSKKGMLYGCWREMSWTFKNKDMERLAKAVEM